MIGGWLLYKSFRDAGINIVVHFPTAEGIKIAIEQIHELQEIPGIAGVHVMAIEWEHRAREIIEGAGLLPRPTVD